MSQCKHLWWPEGMQKSCTKNEQSTVVKYMPCSKCFADISDFNDTTIILLILQMERLSHREAKWISQSYAAKWWYQVVWIQVPWSLWFYPISLLWIPLCSDSSHPAFPAWPCLPKSRFIGFLATQHLHLGVQWASQTSCQNCIVISSLKPVMPGHPLLHLWQFPVFPSAYPQILDSSFSHTPHPITNRCYWFYSLKCA